MPDIAVFNAEGKKVSSVAVEESFLKPGVSAQVVTDTVVAWRANQRLGTACTKTKAEINFSGAKPWKQKGTGRARCGERSSPIWRKGSVAHGPRPHSFRKITPKKVKREALHAVLADKVAQNQIVLVEKIALENPKTKLLTELLGKWNVVSNVMIVLEKGDRNVELAARNIPGVQAQVADAITTYDIIKHKSLLTTPAAWQKLQSRWMPKGVAQ